MNVLFVHNNFPAQFQHVARALAKDSAVNVAAVGASGARSFKGVRLAKYLFEGESVVGTHTFARRFDLECRRAEQVLYALSTLSAYGFVPDLIVAHPGWGETLPLRAVFPKARIVVYCEFFYGVEGRDVGFDPEFASPGIDGHVALGLKNAATLLALSDCDRGVSPTRWQRSTYPHHFQKKIEVIHEGVDVGLAKPNRHAAFMLPGGRVLTSTDEVVTFVARNLEPLRGYHSFMRALPEIVARRPKAEILIIGGDGTSYGSRPPRGATWKAIFRREVADRIDPRRVHFVGRVAYARYIAALQISSAHVYFTYPFVLSWSALEAMSAGCLVIGSDTAPVREMIVHGRNGLLVPFFDTQALAKRVVEALARPARFRSIRAAARKFVVDNYDCEQVNVPQMLRFLKRLAR